MSELKFAAIMLTIAGLLFWVLWLMSLTPRQPHSNTGLSAPAPVAPTTTGSRLSAPSTPTESAVKTGAWRVSKARSQIDDSENVYLALDANETIKLRYGRSYRPTLWLRCQENRTQAFVDWEVFIGSDTTSVLTRLDTQPARTARWSISTDHEATFAPRSIEFIQQLMDYEKLLVQVTPYSESPVVATFNLDGLAEASDPLRLACGW